MVDMVVGIIVLVMVGAAMLYMRKQKKSGAACIGCPCAGSCGKTQCDC